MTLHVVLIVELMVASRAVLMCQWFAPTKFVITTEGMDDSVLVKDKTTGKTIGLKLPEKLVIVSNHQVRSCGEVRRQLDGVAWNAPII